MPSSLNWTPKTPTLSEASAATAMVLATVAPPSGDVIETVGGVRSGFVTLTAGDVLTLPAASRATAVRVWAPMAAGAVSPDMVQGAVVTSAPRLVPSRLNCTPTIPISSNASATAVIVRVTLAPLGGEA